mmetsp:Transcript_29760/g.86334  ORF Transcript_29760/g.86334 Transcript_29760/m.86334 type:complete len:223 (+) Transcript_29760:177-845(+)
MRHTARLSAGCPSTFKCCMKALYGKTGPASYRNRPAGGDSPRPQALRLAEAGVRSAARHAKSSWMLRRSKPLASHSSCVRPSSFNSWSHSSCEMAPERSISICLNKAFNRLVRRMPSSTPMASASSSRIRADDSIMLLLTTEVKMANMDQFEITMNPANRTWSSTDWNTPARKASSPFISRNKENIDLCTVPNADCTSSASAVVPMSIMPCPINVVQRIAQA